MIEMGRKGRPLNHNKRDPNNRMFVSDEVLGGVAGDRERQQEMIDARLFVKTFYTTMGDTEGEWFLEPNSRLHISMTIIRLGFEHYLEKAREMLD